MDLLLILTYVALCIGIFKFFKIPLNKWSVPTAFLGGVFLVGGMMLIMNYNHPFATLARQVYITTPIVPAVSGVVVEVPVRANQRVAQGEVLFRVDPVPYEAILAQREAALAAAAEGVLELDKIVASAQARVARTVADMDRSFSAFQRFERAFERGAITELELDNRRQRYLADKAEVDRANADMERAVIALESEIGGENPETARLRAEVSRARYDVERTTVRAPTDGFVTQLLLRPGMMAVAAPLRPVMVFVHEGDDVLVAAFRQNSILRLEAGFEAEVIFPSIPGEVFSATLAEVLPTIAEGQAQASGSLLSAQLLQGMGRILTRIEVDEDLAEYHLPAGSQAQVAVYSDSFTHLSIIRRVLLRMVSWRNYLFFDH